MLVYWCCHLKAVATPIPPLLGSIWRHLWLCPNEWLLSETLVVISQWVFFAKSATHCGVIFKCRWKVRGMSLSPHWGWAEVRPFSPAINHFLPSQQNRARQRALFFLVFLSLGSWDCPSSGWLTKVICWMFSFYLFVCRTGGKGKLATTILKFGSY